MGPATGRWLQTSQLAVATALWAVRVCNGEREPDRPQAGGYMKKLLDERNALAIQLSA
jgi:hypothetical protein